MKVGIVGTGAIARLHARVYRSLGFGVRAVVDRDEAKARAFVAEFGGDVLPDADALCRHPDVDFVDVCTLPNVRLDIVALCAKHRKPVQVQKPIARTVDIARQMIATAEAAGIVLGVVSQHRFDESSQFLEGAIKSGRLGRLIQCDAYVKWHRTDAYYAGPGKGTWEVEGGGALINQAIHQVDLLRWLVGPVSDVWATWQIGVAHAIESEDNVSAIVKYANGATGVIQASTAIWPGYPERIELHGTKGSAVVTGDRLTTWDVQDDHGGTPPISDKTASGASDPMAISLEPFERQFLDFAEAIRTGRPPAVGGREGLAALEVVEAIYQSCRTGRPQVLAEA